MWKRKWDTNDKHVRTNERTKDKPIILLSVATHFFLFVHANKNKRTAYQQSTNKRKEFICMFTLVMCSLINELTGKRSDQLERSKSLLIEFSVLRCCFVSFRRMPFFPFVVYPTYAMIRRTQFPIPISCGLQCTFFLFSSLHLKFAFRCEKLIANSN